MKMAHSIVSCRDDLGLTTQVLHGPLAKADIVDMVKILLLTVLVRPWRTLHRESALKFTSGYYYHNGDT